MWSTQSSLTPTSRLAGWQLLLLSEHAWSVYSLRPHTRACCSLGDNHTNEAVAALVAPLCLCGVASLCWGAEGHQPCILGYGMRQMDMPSSKGQMACKGPQQDVVSRVLNLGTGGQMGKYGVCSGIYHWSGSVKASSCPSRAKTRCNAGYWYYVCAVGSSSSYVTIACLA